MRLRISIQNTLVTFYSDVGVFILETTTKKIVQVIEIQL